MTYKNVKGTRYKKQVWYHSIQVQQQCPGKERTQVQYEKSVLWIRKEVKSAELVLLDQGEDEWAGDEEAFILKRVHETTCHELQMERQTQVARTGQVEDIGLLQDKQSDNGTISAKCSSK